MPLGMDVGLSPGDFVLDGDPVPLPKKGAEPLTKFSVYVHCGQTAGWIKMPLGMKVGLSPGDSLLDGDPAPSPQRGWSPLPNFLLWPNGWMHQDATWYGGRPPPRGIFVRWGCSPGRRPQFSAHVYCGQTAAWINIALVMEIGLNPVHTVLDGDTASLPKCICPYCLQQCCVIALSQMIFVRESLFHC